MTIYHTLTGSAQVTEWIQTLRYMNIVVYVMNHVQFINVSLVFFMQVGKDNAHLALELVGYDSHVQAAMAHVFGNTFVCTNSEHARKVTFDKQVFLYILMIFDKLVHIGYTCELCMLLLCSFNFICTFQCFYLTFY